MISPFTPTPEIVAIDQAAKSYFGGTVRPGSIRRWVARGIGNPRIKLPAVRIGGRLFVRPADLEAFIAAVADPEVHRRRRKTERCDAAKRRLEEAGA